MAVCVGTTTSYFYCFYGRLTIDSYARMADLLFESDWQKLPVNLQKYVTLMIADMQRPVYYHGFGILVLDLETFANVRIYRLIYLFHY